MILRICVIVNMTAVCAFAQAADGKFPDTQQSKNLVTNSSLEESVGRNGLPQDWRGFGLLPANSYNYSVVKGGRTGKKAIRIEGDGTFGVVSANRVEIDRTKRYVVRGWVKIAGDKEATADVKFHYYAANGGYIGQTRTGYVSPTTDDWQFVTVTDRASSFPQAKFVGLAFAATGKAEALFDDLELIAFDKDHLPKDFENDYGITRSSQLSLLGRRVGTWKTKTTINPCLWFPNGSNSTGVETIRWSLGGQFIEGRAKNLTTDSDSQFLMTFDRKSTKYRSWYFDSQGNFPRGESIGTWNQQTQTFTFEATEASDVHSEYRLKLIDNDTLEWSATWTDKTGKVLLDMEGTAQRSKD